MQDIPIPPPESIIYEDDKLYVCLASYPITAGHTVAVWKDKVEDLGDLNQTQYTHLMNVVDKARDTLQIALKIEKVYLVYMDEIKHVHWHLVPRYDEQGFNMFLHQPKLQTDFAFAAQLKRDWLTS